jgi:hypothetical protein
MAPIFKNTKKQIQIGNRGNRCFRKLNNNGKTVTIDIIFLIVASTAKNTCAK